MIDVIVNENAGDASSAESRSSHLGSIFKKFGVEARFHSLQPDGTISDLAKTVIDGGADTVVAAGGDGTIGAVAGACHAAGVRMGVIPQGTFNYFARAHDIPEDAEAAVQLIAEGTMRETRLGTVNDRIFLNNVSIGVYPRILKNREDVYKKYGRSRPAAYWSVFTTLVNRPRVLKATISLDGQVWNSRTPLVFVAKSAFQLKEFNMAGQEDLGDGDFAVIVVPDEDRMSLLGSALRVWSGQARRGPDYKMMTGQNIDISLTRRRVLVACDGEKFVMRTPLRISHHERKLRLIAPEKPV